MQLPEIVDPSFVNTWIDNQSSEEYHADKTAVSSTGLRKLLKSPATFALYLKEPPKASDAMRLGSLVHMAILEPQKFKERVIVSPHFGDLRISKNREARNIWNTSLNEHMTVIDDSEYQKVVGMVHSIERHNDAYNALNRGVAERSGFYRDPATGVKCKIRPDFLTHDGEMLIDLKTTQDCTYDEFAKTIWNYRYDFQAQMYREGIYHITGKYPRYTTFLSIEKQPPYEVGFYYCEENELRRGVEDYHRTLEILKRCLDHPNEWIPYQTTIQPIKLPSWVLSKMVYN